MKHHMKHHMGHDMKECMMHDMKHHKGHHMKGHMRHSHDEGRLTKSVENVTAKVPSLFYLGIALGAMATSLALKCAKKNHNSLFVGQWAAPLLIMGLYNKIVKTEGHDRHHRR